MDFSAEILQVRKEWDDIFEVLKGKNYQTRALYPAKLSLKNGDIFPHTRVFGSSQKEPPLPVSTDWPFTGKIPYQPL